MSEERTRDRNRNQTGSGGNSGSSEGGPSRSEIQERANRLRNLGNVIQNTLSGDSQRYLDQSRQRGGQ